MYLLGRLLLPGMFFGGLIFLLLGYFDRRDGVATAGAILLAAVLLSISRERRRPSDQSGTPA